MSENGFSARPDGTFEICGRMTFHTVPALLAKTAHWLNDTSGAVTIDLSKVQWADSAGLALMIEWLHQARVVGRELRFINFPEQIKHMIGVSGLADAFGIA